MKQYFLSGALSVSKTDNSDLANHYCVFIGQRAFHGSERIVQLLQAIDAETELSTIVRRLNRDGDGHLVTEKEILFLIEQRFIPDGLVVTSLNAVAGLAKKPRSHLFLSQTLVDAATVARIAIKFRFFFSPVISITFTATMLVLLGVWLWQLIAAGSSFGLTKSGFTMSWQDSLLFYGLMFFCFLVHELGHAAASARFGSKPAEIGVGLYLIFPVLFCNVTDAWRLPRMQRVVVSLGGGYFQVLACAMLVPFQLASSSALLSFVIATNLMSILVTLNPFFRFDGYWVYADFFCLANLRERSRRCVSAMLVKILFGMRNVDDRASTALRIYTLGSALFFTWFSVTMVYSATTLINITPALYNSAILHYQLDPSANAIGDLVSSGVMYLVFMIGCALTFSYIVSTFGQGIAEMRKMFVDNRTTQQSGMT